MLTGGGFWAWVSGNRPWLDWRQLFTARAAVLALAGLAVPMVWRILLQRKWPGWAVALAVAAGFACAEAAVRIPAAQTAFWLATEARIPAKANMSFMHDVCHVRLETSAMQDPQTPAIVLVGSSQVVEGVDKRLLDRLLPGRVVVKRAVSSMCPLHMLAAQEYIPIHAGDIVVHYLSEFDFTNQDEFEFPHAWFRPFASWEGWQSVSRVVGWQCMARHWQECVDFAVAASLETWRQRDWLRTAFVRAWGRSSEDSVFDGEMPAARGMWVALQNGGDGEFKASLPQKRAMEEWVVHVAGQGASAVVFEGQVNPEWRTLERQRWHDETAEWLESFSMRGLPVRYVRLPEDFPEGDWHDHTHLNAVGREKLTRAMGRILAGCGGAE